MSNIYQGLLSGAPNSMQGIPGGSMPSYGQMPGFQQNQSMPMGQWSSLAYQMAGRPQQGGALPSVAMPSGPGISGIPSSGSSGGGSSSGILGAVLGTALKNPGLVKNLGGLLGNLGGVAAGTAGNAAVGAGSTLATEAGGTGLVAGTGGGLGAGAAIPAGLQASGATTFGLGAAPTTVGSALGADGAATAAGSGASAAGSGASAGALGAGLGGALAVGGVLAPALAGLLTPAYSLSSKYWTGVNNNLTGGKSNPNFWPAALEAINTPQSQVPQNIQQLVWASGLVPQGQWGETQTVSGKGSSGTNHNATKY